MKRKRCAPLSFWIERTDDPVPGTVVVYVHGATPATLLPIGDRLSISRGADHLADIVCHPDPPRDRWEAPS